MIRVVEVQHNESERIISSEEGHFLDLKSKDVAPAKLTQTICAMANADGGEVYIGIEDDPRLWSGFTDIEDANGHIQIFDRLFPLGSGFLYNFITCGTQVGYILKVEILKSHDVVAASNGTVYLRRSAQNLPQTDNPSLERLRRNKGISSFETEVINCDAEVIVDSDVTESFMCSVLPGTEPKKWLKKQQLIRNDQPTVAGAMLFAEEPQALLPKRSGIKIYRYETREAGERSRLVYDPITVEGSAYYLIKKALNETVRQIEEIMIMTESGLAKTRYPKEALHEIITNAVLHRDYSVPDDVHIRIFDNRVEVQSPGLLPAHITPDNILNERFSRNGVLVRLINKFPDAPNKDVGEGLNTAFEAMRTMRLVSPVIQQSGMNVIVTLRHEALGSPESLIMKYLETNDYIANKQAREVTNQGSENTIKHVLRRMVDAGMLEVIKGKTVFDTKYVAVKKLGGGEN
jgi:ATP-dependent DNA helicase RecG